MKKNEGQWARYKRIKLIKKILKYLPRRANTRRYPILKYFAEAAEKRTYLWSFRVTEAVPALLSPNKRSTDRSRATFRACP